MNTTRFTRRKIAAVLLAVVLVLGTASPLLAAPTTPLPADGWFGRLVDWLGLPMLGRDTAASETDSHPHLDPNGGAIGTATGDGSDSQTTTTNGEEESHPHLDPDG